ncbi:MAG: homocysteine S-methyltransferase family protein [Clostridia bacterium]|nr:homocysteine S-methyltransferase family protein [Clostridia bacterium]
MNILERIRSGRLIADGAMGTMLQSMGLRVGAAPESWNIDKPENVLAVHKAYTDVGCELLTTNTFGCNKLRQRRSKYSIAELAAAGVSLAREAADNAGHSCYVALDVGPLGAFLEPLGTVSFDEATALFAESIAAGAEKADCVLIETMGDTREASAAVKAAKENCTLPVFSTFSVDKNGRLLSGEDLPTMLARMTDAGVDALGCNCGLGPEEFLPFAESLCGKTDLPLIFSLNAGLPVFADGKTVYPLSPEAFADNVKKIAALGGSVFGGCCGTGPAYIEQLVRVLK